jgi:hypothetical protein
MEDLMRTLLLTGASVLALTFTAGTAAAAVSLSGILEAPKASTQDGGEQIILAKRGRSGTGLRGRDRERPDDNPTGDDGTPDQGQGNDDDGPDAPDTPGDDDGTPDQGSGDR